MHLNDTIEKTRHFADDAARHHAKTVRSTRRDADHGVDKLEDPFHQMGADAVPSLQWAADQATHWTQLSAQQIRQGSRQLLAKASFAAHDTRQYVRDEPIKSALIAAGVGALLLGFVKLLSRQGARH